MKALDYIRSLSSKEQKAFDKLIAGHKRDSLKALYKLLKKHKEQHVEPTKAQMYKAAYGDKYDKKKDYLLRNELRLLSLELEDYLIHRTIDETMEERAGMRGEWLARMQYRRKLYGLYEKEFPKILETAIEEEYRDIAGPAMYEYLRYYYRYKQGSNQVDEKVLELVQQYRKLLMYRFAHDIHLTTEIHNYTVRHMRNKGYANLEFLPPDDTVNLLAPEVHTNTAKYQYYNSTLYPKEGEELRQHFRGMADHVKQMYPPRMREKIFIVLGRLAVEYVKADMNNEAGKIYEEMQQQEKEQSVRMDAHTAINMIVHYTMQQEYETAMRHMQERREDLIDKGNFRSLFVLTNAFLHLMLGQPEQALDYVVVDEKATALRTEAYIRFVLIMAFYQMEQFQDADRELRNLKGLLKSKGQPPDLDLSKILLSYELLFKTNYAIADKKTALLKQLEDTIREAAEPIQYFMLEKYLIHWLNKQASLLSN